MNKIDPKPADEPVAAWHCSNALMFVGPPKQVENMLSVADAVSD